MPSYKKKISAAIYIDKLWIGRCHLRVYLSVGKCPLEILKVKKKKKQYRC